MKPVRDKSDAVYVIIVLAFIFFSLIGKGCRPQLPPAAHLQDSSVKSA